MTSLGRVRVWHDEDGWGVLDSEDTPGGCWASFACVLVAGYRTLATGQEVAFDFEAPGQDGYSFRAVEVWPAGQEPVRTPPMTGPSAAYGSASRVEFHGEDGASRT